MPSILKVNQIQKTSSTSNIINKSGSTITLGASGTTVSLACGATATGFGATSFVDWCTTAKTAPFTGAAGTGYFVNTSCGAITVTLPATPTAGDIVSLKDYGGTWATNNVTICGNSSKINGVCATATLNTNSQSVTLIYVDATKGWQDIQDSTAAVSGNPYILATGGTVTTCGNYKIHTFTADGCFSVSSAGIPANSNVDYLVVAGGGGGGHDNGGGGGAGGFRISSGAASGCYTRSPLGACVSAITVTSTTYPITVGGGGAGGTSACGGADGSNSIFSTITSTGGGGGGATGRPGGSGGGSCVPGNPAGTGNTPPVNPPQGNNGATRTQGAPSYGGGGGGGAGAAGTSPTGPTAGSGGDGSYSNINSSTGVADGPVPGARYYAGGGASQGQGGTMGTGGAGGGAGAGGPTHNAVGGTVNTGGGGEGGRGCGPPVCGGAGGSGIVILRYRYQ